LSQRMVGSRVQRGSQAICPALRSGLRWSLIPAPAAGTTARLRRRCRRGKETRSLLDRSGRPRSRPRSGVRRRRCPSLISLQLSLAPMRVFTIGVEHALDAAIECPHDANASKHRRATEIHDEEKGLHRGLPLRCRMFGLRQPRDVSRRVTQGDKLATAGSGYRIVEGAAPSPIANDASPFCRIGS